VSPHAARFLKAIHKLRQAGLAQLVQLGETFNAWTEEIAKGFHNKLALVNRQAFGFRNFHHCRLRVKV